MSYGVVIGESRRVPPGVEGWAEPQRIGRAGREPVRDRFRRWWRGRFRHTGLVYWLITQGYLVLLSCAVLFCFNGFVLGWGKAYEISALIASPWEVADGSHPDWVWFPALLLSIAGWLVVTGFAGAVAGYMVINATTNRSGPRGDRLGPLPSGNIPRLANLQYSRHGHEIPPYFALRFAMRHEGDWRQAQDHWERMVMHFLRTDGFDGGDGADSVMRQSVTYTSYFLHGLSGRCPECHGRAHDGAED